MKTHLAKCKENQNIIPLKTFAKFAPKNIEISPEILGKWKLLLAKFVAGTFSSFNLIESQFLFDLIQFAIEIGSKFGDVDVRSIMYTRKSIRTKVFETVENINEKLKNSLSVNKHFSLVTDIWSDPKNHDSFIDLTVFYIENFELKHQMLAFR